MGCHPNDGEAVLDRTSDQEALVSPTHAWEATSQRKPRLLVPLWLCRKEGWKLLLAAALFVALLCATLFSVKATHILGASIATEAVGLHARSSRAATLRVADAASTGGTRSFAQVHVTAAVKEVPTPHFIKRPVQWSVELTHKWVGMMEKFKVTDLPDGRATIQTMYGFVLTPQHDGKVTADGVVGPDGERGPPIDSGAGAWVIDKKGDKVNLRSPAYGKCAAWNDAVGLHLAGCNLTAATFTPAKSTWGSLPRTGFRLKNGWYLGLRPSLLQDFHMVLRAVKPSTQPEVSTCMRFYLHEGQGDKMDGFSLQTWRGSYVSFKKNGSIRLDADKIGDTEQWKQLQGKNGSVSFVTSSGTVVHAWKNGEVNSSNTVEDAEKDFNVVPNKDGTVGIHTQSGTAFCAMEQVIKIITCETRRSGAPTFVMQGIQPAVLANNVGAGKKWYGYRTKVELYRHYTRARAKLNIPGELIIAIDAADVAWGGCTYQDLLDRYHTISRLLGGTPVVVGADNKAWPKPKSWGYGELAHLREPLMSAYGMHKDTYCNFSNCSKPKDSHYAFANSGFMMGPPKQLLFVLECMRKKGFGDYAESGFDDQAGLQECIFKHKDLIGIDYTGLLSLQLIDMNHNGVLYYEDGKVKNLAAGGMTQCFVHGNGDTLGMWWKELFHGQQMSEKWGEDFQH